MGIKKVMFDVKSVEVYRDEELDDKLYLGMMILSDENEIEYYETHLIENQFLMQTSDITLKNNQYVKLLAGFRKMLAVIIEDELIEDGDGIEFMHQNKVLLTWLDGKVNEKYKSELGKIKRLLTYLISKLSDDSVISYIEIDKNKNKVTKVLNKEIKVMLKEEEELGISIPSSKVNINDNKVSGVIGDKNGLKDNSKKKVKNKKSSYIPKPKHKVSLKDIN